jgi:uncharacterized protein (DUF1800 family)
MALDPSPPIQAFIAATRFGLGPRPGDLAAFAGDPRGWLSDQLDRPQTPAEISALPPPQDQIRRFMALRREQIEERKRLGFAQAQSGTTTRLARSTVDASQAPRVTLMRDGTEPSDELPPMGAAQGGVDRDGARKAMEAEFNAPLRAIYLGEMEARTLAAVHSETPLYERMVAFWSNHFTVSVQRGEVAGLCGPFEREAIRPHVTGSFGAMLNAVMRHPAMLTYLDNARSIGPDSFAAWRNPDKHLGINENLGRELLELHTLGVGTGYTQADVIAMARMLTGWTVAPPNRPDAGDFRFEPRFHEPGDKIFLGATYRESGMGEAQAALETLARHPATAHHLATKIARHFIADDPPPAAVERIASVYLRTGGNLAAVTRAAIESPEAWRDPLAKVKSPQDFLVATLRATGFTPQDDRMLVVSLRLMGQGPFAAPSPAGWGDDAQTWLGPDSLMRRIEWSQAVARKIGSAVLALDVAHATIGPVASAGTLRGIATAGTPEDRLTMLLASREFQRR